MKSKIILGILTALAICSSAINIYQYNNQNQLNQNLQSIQAEIDSINETYNSLLDKISEKENEISALSEEAENLKSEIQIQQSENDSLKKQIENLQVKSVAVENVEVQVGNDESIEQNIEASQKSVQVSDTEENNGVVINPETGKPAQPGESWDAGNGWGEVTYVGEI